MLHFQKAQLNAVLITIAIAHSGYSGSSDSGVDNSGTDDTPLTLQSELDNTGGVMSDRDNNGGVQTGAVSYTHLTLPTTPYV